MPFTVTLVDPNNTSQTITFTPESFEGFNYDDDATGFLAAMAAVAKTQEYVGLATSTTSHNFTTGSKTFTIVGGFGFAAGSAVRMANVAGTSYMDGLVTACTPNSSVTITVLGVGAGSGANASWVITFGTNTSTIVSTPVSLANGGTAGATAAAARTNLEVGRLFRVISVLSAPPGSPVNGDTYLAGSSPTGAWSGHQDEVPIYASGWTFTVPSAGDVAYDAGAKAYYVYTGTAQYTNGIFAGSKWKPLTPVKTRWTVGSDITANYSVVAADHGVWRRALPASGNIAITLPLLGGTTGINGMEIVIETSASNGFSTTISISGGSNIRLADGTTSASIVVAASTYKLLHLVAGQSGTGDLWYVWR